MRKCFVCPNPKKIVDMREVSLGASHVGGKKWRSSGHQAGRIHHGKMRRDDASTSSSYFVLVRRLPFPSPPSSSPCGFGAPPLSAMPAVKQGASKEGGSN